MFDVPVQSLRCFRSCHFRRPNSRVRIVFGVCVFWCLLCCHVMVEASDYLDHQLKYSASCHDGFVLYNDPFQLHRLFIMSNEMWSWKKFNYFGVYSHYTSHEAPVISLVVFYVDLTYSCKSNQESVKEQLIASADGMKHVLLKCESVMPQHSVQQKENWVCKYRNERVDLISVCFG